MLSPAHRPVVAQLRAALLALLALFSIPRVHAADQKYWELSPYRVHLHLSVDDSRQPQPRLGSQLTASLQQKIRTTLYPLWSTKVSLTQGAERERLLTQLPQLGSQPLSPKQLTALTTGYDKQIYLNVQASPLGIRLAAREFDCTTLRWGAVQRRSVRQSWMLPSQCFDLVCQTFSPLATIRPLAEDHPEQGKEIVLRFRGSDLPQQTDLGFLNHPGEAYQPLMVRTNSRGEVKTDSIREIPWTFLTLGQHQEEGWHGIVHTGTRRPFGVRRRGRVEHLALAMRKPEGATKVRFYARHDQAQGLSGYEVFRRAPNSATSQPLGLTDIEGAVEVFAGAEEVTLLFLRSEGQLLAKVPVAAGATPTMEVPVADDTARLRAQSALTAITEQLVDTVAQRNILMARVRTRLAEGEIETAQTLFSDLDSLPGRTHFDQQIKSAENRQLHQSSDPKVQARIEKLFADTRKLLFRFLNVKQISELQNELTAARRGKAF